MQLYCHLVIRDDVNGEDLSNLVFTLTARNGQDCLEMLEKMVESEIDRLGIGDEGRTPLNVCTVFGACQSVLDGPMNTATWQHPAGYCEFSKHL